ncbi:MAG: hypothetical protein RLZZ314_1380 [Bacteroidota bacterium]|jgi:glucose-1-phosphate thymidylyltransferase
MNIIIPMAGRGSRLRPHTLTVPKPLVPVAGKPIVERLVEDIVRTAHQGVDNIVFVTGQFGEEVERDLIAVAERLGAKGHIRYQEQPLGTAHAILCGQDFLEGPVVVAFADTLFRANFTIDPEADGVLFCQKIEDPSAFGVVVTDDSGTIVDYVEKPQEWVGDLAMIGMYAFKDGARLRKELQRLIDQNIAKGGEYQLPDALRHMTQHGVKFIPGEVSEWMDCGNKAVTVETNARMLSILEEEGRLDAVPASARVVDSVILQPCHLGEGVVVERSVVGPHVTLGAGTIIRDARIQNALVAEDSLIQHAVIEGAMVGAHAAWHGTPEDASLGDYSTLGTPRP